MTLALLIPVAGMIILVLYFVFESATVDPWKRNERD